MKQVALQSTTLNEQRNSGFENEIDGATKFIHEMWNT